MALNIAILNVLALLVELHLALDRVRFVHRAHDVLPAVAHRREDGEPP